MCHEANWMRELGDCGLDEGFRQGWSWSCDCRHLAPCASLICTCGHVCLCTCFMARCRAPEAGCFRIALTNGLRRLPTFGMKPEGTAAHAQWHPPIHPATHPRWTNGRPGSMLDQMKVAKEELLTKGSLLIAPRVFWVDIHGFNW